MSERKQILLIKPIVPYPPNQGTRIVSMHVISALSERHDVTVLARTIDASCVASAEALREHCHRVVTVAAPNRRSPFHRAAYKFWYTVKSYLRRRSMKSQYDCPGAFVAAARRLAAETDYDLVIVEYWQLFPMLDVFPEDKTVLLTHDIDLLVNREKALLERRLFPKMKAVRRWVVEQGEEVRAYLKVNRILALTERDAAAARKLSKDRARVDVLPFGMDASRYRDADLPARRTDEVLFMGAMHAPFNADAISYFVSKIYPHLDNLDADFTVVGGALPQDVAHFGGNDRVNVVGYVDDVRECLARATCIIIPMRFGGGLRIRILEAMLAGLPVVCTSVAIAGMDFRAGEDFLLADEPVELADAVRRMLDDAPLRENLAVNARARVLERYESADARKRLLALLEEYMEQ